MVLARGALKAYEGADGFKLYYNSCYVKTVTSFEQVFAVCRYEYDTIKSQYNSLNECVTPAEFAPMTTTAPSKIHQPSEFGQSEAGELAHKTHHVPSVCQSLPLPLHTGSRYSNNRRRIQRKIRH